MAATFEIYKYTGKECQFGTLVSSIGLKRIDAAVPAVYGSPIVPGDDKSDVNSYSVYRPDTTTGVTYSYESIFKLKLKTPPSTQLSNIRIYPATAKPADTNLPILYIGCSQTYSRPTNVQSLVAIYDIWTYTKDNPFKVTVGGNVGQSVNQLVPVQIYNMTQNDIGAGNIIYLNGQRQVTVPIVQGRSYQFIDKTSNAMTFTVYDAVTNLPVSHADITAAIVGTERVVTLNATASLLAAHPNGFKYGHSTNIALGGLITILDLNASPITTVEYTVGIETLSSGQNVYTLNGVRNPQLNFLQNMKYKFINPHGATDPIRFLNNYTSTCANVEGEIIIDGVEVTNGATASEVVIIDPNKVKTAGKKILSYQSTKHAGYGNKITNIDTALIGNYNVNTVNGGTTNPLAAGETDFIYLQLKVTGASTVGSVLPELKIEYDEN